MLLDCPKPSALGAFVCVQPTGYLYRKEYDRNMNQEMSPIQQKIQKAAQEVNEVLQKYGLAIQPTIEIYEVQKTSPIIAAGNGPIPDFLAEPKIMPDMKPKKKNNLLEVSEDEEIMAKMLKPVGDTIE